MYAAPSGTPNQGAKLVIVVVTASSRQRQKRGEHDELEPPVKRDPGDDHSGTISQQPHGRSADDDPDEKEPVRHQDHPRVPPACHPE